MSNRTLNLDDALYGYLLDVSLRETPLQQRLREETAALPVAQWQIAPEQGQFMALLVQLSGARRLLEIGTFTGYSALSMAMALPDDGHLLCCDIDQQYTDIARRYWKEAGVAGRIELRLAEGPFKSLEGSWDFLPLADDVCKVALRMNFETAGLLMGSALALGFQSLTDRLVDDFVREAMRDD